MKQESIPVGCMLPICADSTCFDGRRMSALVRGVCCDIGQNDTFSKIELIPSSDLSSRDPIVLPAV